MKLRITAAKIDCAGFHRKVSVVDRGKILYFRSKFSQNIQIILVIKAKSFIFGDCNYCFLNTCPAIHITKLPYSFWQFHFYLCRSPSLLNNPIQIDSHSNLFFDQIQPLPDPQNLLWHHKPQMAGFQSQIL